MGRRGPGVTGRQFVAQWVPPVLREDAVLVTRELVSNAIEHANSSVALRVVVDDKQVRVEVSDSSAILPAVANLVNEVSQVRTAGFGDGRCDASVTGAPHRQPLGDWYTLQVLTSA